MEETKKQRKKGDKWRKKERSGRVRQWWTYNGRVL